MTRAAAVLAAGLGFGAGLMYYFDPDRGSRRRAHARNQMRRASHQIRESAGTPLRALRRSSADSDDDILTERARAALGHVVSHAHALALKASRGVLTISGPILPGEIRLALTALRKVSGVRRIVNAM